MSHSTGTPGRGRGPADVAVNRGLEETRGTGESPITRGVLIRRIEALIEPLQSALSADGAQLRLTTERDGRVTFALTLVAANCADCVLPRQMLEDIVLAALRAELPAVVEVSIDDPREIADERQDDQTYS